MNAFWKRTIIGFGAMALIAGGIATAGINPTGFGLPDNVTPASVGYASGLTVQQSAADGSMMCVACHSRNPSLYVKAPTDIGSGTPQTDNTVHGSHWVTYNFADTSTSGGYPDDGGKNTTAGKYIHRGPWAATSGAVLSSGSSKYSYIVTGQVSNYVPGATDSIDNTAGSTTNTQIICESCHNIRYNIGPKKLLAQAIPNFNNVDNGATLCAGCHGDMRHEVNNEPAYFKASGAQDHHRNSVGGMTGLTTNIYKGTATLAASPAFAMHELDLNGWDNAVSRYWSVGPGGLPSISATPRTINPGTVDISLGYQTTASGTLTCSQCHRAHNATSSTGALILQRGGSASDFGLLTDASTNYSTHGWVQNQRLIGSGKSSATRLLKDDQGVCIGCHSEQSGQ